MRVYGLDFTSAPTTDRPLWRVDCTLEGDVLYVDGIERAADTTDYAGLEAFLYQPGPWITALDFPFGLPRKLVDDLGWPPVWAGYVEHVRVIGRDAFLAVLQAYKDARPSGEKELFRETDRWAKGQSPMKSVRPPLAQMFFEGAPRLLASGATIPPLHAGDADRICVEGYPKLVKEACIGAERYKDDKTKGDTPERQARGAILDALRSGALQDLYGVRVEVTDEQVEEMVDDTAADKLDGLLCAVQAVWGWGRRDDGFGIPAGCGPPEGWIVDPAGAAGAPA